MFSNLLYVTARVFKCVVVWMIKVELLKNAEFKQPLIMLFVFFLVSWLFSWHAFIGFRPLAQEIVCLTSSKESIFFQCWIYVPTPGLKIATDTVANATNIFSLATKNYS